jgi:hypothetical protein
MVGIKRREPDQPVNSVLCFQVTTGIPADNSDDGTFYAGLLTCRSAQRRYILSSVSAQS